MLFDSEKSATSGDATDKFMLARNLKRRGSRSKPPATSRRDDTFLNRLHVSRENKRDARGSKKPTAPTGFEFDRPRTPGPRRQMPFSSANHVVDFETDPTSYTENNNQQGEDDEGVCDEEEVLRFDANKRRGGKVVRRDAGESTKPNNKKDKSCSFYVPGAAGANVGGNRKKESNKRRWTRRDCDTELLSFLFSISNWPDLELIPCVRRIKFVHCFSRVFCGLQEAVAFFA